jgi:hypothetical protein
MASEYRVEWKYGLARSAMRLFDDLIDAAQYFEARRKMRGMRDTRLSKRAVGPWIAIEPKEETNGTT